MIKENKYTYRTITISKDWFILSIVILLLWSMHSTDVLAQSKPLRIEKLGSPEGSFHVLSSLIIGPTESIVFDGQYRVSGGKRLAEKIKSTGTQLKAIILSHADHDHYMGAMEVLKEFPNTLVYATKATIEDFNNRSQSDLEYERKHADSSEVPEELISPQPLPSNIFTVDGHEVILINGLVGDVKKPASTALWVPSLKTILAGDLVFDGIHPWLGDCTAASREDWRASLRKLAAFDPIAVIPGHKKDLNKPDSPDQIAFMIKYLDNYDAAMDKAQSPEEVESIMVEQYPDLTWQILMAYGAKKWFKK